MQLRGRRSRSLAFLGDGQRVDDKPAQRPADDSVGEAQLGRLERGRRAPGKGLGGDGKGDGEAGKRRETRPELLGDREERLSLDRARGLGRERGRRHGQHVVGKGEKLGGEGSESGAAGVGGDQGQQPRARCRKALGHGARVVGGVDREVKGQGGKDSLRAEGLDGSTDAVLGSSSERSVVVAVRGSSNASDRLKQALEEGRSRGRHGRRRLCIRRRLSDRLSSSSSDGGGASGVATCTSSGDESLNDREHLRPRRTGLNAQQRLHLHHEPREGHVKRGLCGGLGSGGGSTAGSGAPRSSSGSGREGVGALELCDGGGNSSSGVGTSADNDTRRSSSSGSGGGHGRRHLLRERGNVLRSQGDSARRVECGQSGERSLDTAEVGSRAGGVSGCGDDISSRREDLSDKLTRARSPRSSLAGAEPEGGGHGHTTVAEGRVGGEVGGESTRETEAVGEEARQGLEGLDNHEGVALGSEAEHLSEDLGRSAEREERGDLLESTADVESSLAVLLGARLKL